MNVDIDVLMAVVFRPNVLKEMYDVDFNKDLKMQGRMQVNYGEGENGCKQPEGSISGQFIYSTTPEARESLKQKSYYRSLFMTKNLFVPLCIQEIYIPKNKA